MIDDKYVEILIKYNITANQFMLCYMLYLKKISKLQDYINNVNAERDEEGNIVTGIKPFQRKEIQDLIRKGYIIDLNLPKKVKTGETLYDEQGSVVNNTFLTFYVVSDKFSENIFIDTKEAGEELWKSYPHSFKINNSMFVARAGDKDELMDLYARKIKNCKDKHQFVMKSVKEYVKLVNQGKINAMKIENFIKSEIWETIHEIIKENGVSGFNTRTY